MDARKVAREIPQISIGTCPLQPVELNNYGAGCLENERFSEAIRAFSEALRLARDEMVREQAISHLQVPAVSDGSQRTESARLSVLKESIPQVAVSGDRSMTWMYATTIPRRSGCTFFVYQAPIRVEEYGSSVGPSSLCAIFLFNLALACHLDAVKQRKSKPFFDKAIQLYQNAYNLQIQEQRNPSIIYSHENVLLRVMAILNNLAHIHFILGNDRRGQECCEHLYKTVLYAKYEDSSRSKCVECFFNNVTHLVVKHTQGAPAA